MSAHTPVSKPDRTAYRGYLVTRNLTGDVYFISKDGFMIGSAPTYESAKQTIDLVLGD